MSSFLGVPIKVRGEVYGNLYLTDKIGWSEFNSDDAALVEVLALAAGIAIENTRLHTSRCRPSLSTRTGTVWLETCTTPLFKGCFGVG